MTKVNLHI